MSVIDGYTRPWILVPVDADDDVVIEAAAPVGTGRRGIDDDVVSVFEVDP